MGGTTFHETGTGADPAAVFNRLRDEAAWEHGHGGYTGTIAEKPGFRVFTLPPGKTIADLNAALGGQWDPATRDWVQGDKAWLPAGLLDTYEDKWGDAVAVREDDETEQRTIWHFLGWASS